jgi:SpoVK/Ycf46/Vps4 family AAA+-type ATPase
MSIRVYTDVDIDVDDVIEEIPLERLKEEIERRTNEPLKTPEVYSDFKMRNAISDWLNLREWEIRDEKVFMSKLKERLFP